MMPPEQLFNRLIVALHQASHLDGDRPWRYTPQLQQVANALVRALPGQMLVTHMAFRQLLNEPLRAWWPVRWPVPAAFDPTFSLLDGILLSEEASAYYYIELEKVAEVAGQSPHAVQVALDNEDFRSLMQELREQKIKQPQQAATVQQEYVALRCFLIEEPITTHRRISSAFSSRWFVRAAQVGRLYEACRGPAWHCEHCGPLLRTGGQRRGIRPSVCGDHLADQPTVREVAEAPDLLRIRSGIHWRTCFPGKPELSLHRRVEELAREYPHALESAELWPGLDQYDLRICFRSGEVWAVDVKDQRDPGRLGRNLSAIDGFNDLPYSRAFYVIPDRWLGSHPETYLRTAREHASLPENHAIVGLGSFVDMLTSQLRKDPKKNRRAQ
jgi:REase associating with pPIWI_RE